MSESTSTPPAAYRATPQYRALVNLLQETRKGVRASGLDRGLAELMNLLSSSINGCQECWKVHAEEAQRRGVEKEKIDALHYMDANAAVNFEKFSDAERAALALTTALTQPGSSDVAGAFAAAREHFSAAEVEAMEWLIVSINSFNRVTIAHEEEH